jgi:type I restriction enzyme S subunit
MKTSWTQTTLEEVCLKITDGAHNSPKSVKCGLPMASVKDLTPHGINIETCRHIATKDFEKLVKQGCQPEPGDVLIAKDGNSALDTVCEIKEKLNVVLLSSVAIFRPNNHKIISSYLRYFLDSDTTRNYLKNGFITGAAIPRVVLKDFKRCQVFLPSLPTQQKIASILSTYDDLIENNTRRIKILETMAQTLYQEWFVKFRFPGHEQVKMVESDLGLIPESWEVKPISEVIETTGGGTPSTKKAEYWNDGDIAWFSPSDLTAANSMFINDSSKKINSLGLKKSSAKLFPAYSVMMTSRATIGVVSINTQPACTNQGFITCIPNEQLSMYLIYYWLISNKDKIINLASGATFKEINKTTFRKLPIVIPETKIQELFIQLLEPIFKQVENLQQKNNNLQKTRDLLLPKLISGQIDVENLDIDTGDIAA